MAPPKKELPEIVIKDDLDDTNDDSFDEVVTPGEDGFGYGSRSRDDTSTVRNRRSASSSGIGTSGISTSSRSDDRPRATVSPSGGTINTTPIASPISGKSNSAPSGIGSASDSVKNSAGDRGSRGSSGSSTDSNRGTNQSTEKGTASTAKASPRQVGISDLTSFHSASDRRGGTKASADATRLSKEFITESLSVLFDGFGAIVGDKEWHLEDPDATVLGERFHGWLRSIDPKKSAIWEKRFAKWEPAGMLLIAFFLLVVPRIEHTVKLKRDARNIPKQNTGTRTASNPQSSGSNPASATPGATSSYPNGGTGGPVPFDTARFHRHEIIFPD